MSGDPCLCYPNGNDGNCPAPGCSARSSKAPLDVPEGPLDRGEAVNLARQVVEENCPVTPKGVLLLAEGVIEMDAVLKRLYARSAIAPKLPKAPGVSRDKHHGITVFFERDLTDDEMRDLHDWINGRYPATYETLMDSTAPYRKRVPTDGGGA